jgi:hypothetical protein
MLYPVELRFRVIMHPMHTVSIVAPKADALQKEWRPLRDSNPNPVSTPRDGFKPSWVRPSGYEPDDLTLMEVSPTLKVRGRYKRHTLILVSHTFSGSVRVVVSGKQN